MGKIPGVDNYGSLLNNRKYSGLSGRNGYTDGTKVNLFRAYPFAYVPENTWSGVAGSGYVTEKAYDAYIAATLPIWEGTLGSLYLPLYFPISKTRNQTLLRVRDYPGWKNASALADHIRNLMAKPSTTGVQTNQLVFPPDEWGTRLLDRFVVSNNGDITACVYIVQNKMNK